MSVDKNFPEIRFSGFSEGWEEYPLSTFISSLDAGISVNSGDRSANESEFGILKTSCVTNGFFEPNENKIVFKAEEINRLKEPVLENTIIISRMNTPVLVGANAYISRGYANYFLPDRLWAAKPTSTGNLKFIAYILGSYKGRLALSDLATGTSGSMKNISKPSVLQLMFRAPRDQEQTQIGNYFQKLDNLINQHQQKHDKLSSIKKAMLEKMFPKQGETVPEIRFKGFGGEWVEKELGAVAEIKTGPFGSTLHAKAYVEDGYPIITTEHFKSGELPVEKKGIPQVSDDDYLRLKAYLLKIGDIVFSRVGSVDINAHITNKQEGWLFSGRVLRVRSDSSIDSKYLHHELSTSRVKKSVVSRAVGQTMPSINTEILKITTIHFPLDTAEQTKIGNFFQKLDTLINQHQQQITKLNNIKQACLSKMFV